MQGNGVLGAGILGVELIVWRHDALRSYGDSLTKQGGAQ